MVRGRWMLRVGAAVVIGVGLGVACSVGRTYCQHYAETVAECCPQHDYGTLRSLCRIDSDNGYAIGAACGQATREVYDCAAGHACDHACAEVSPDPCQGEQMALVGACAVSPEPPKDP